MASNLNEKTKSQSYSSIIQSSPSKEQAIVITAHDSLTTKDYAFAVGKITDPSNIRFISKISNSRICIYLASKRIAEDIANKYQKITINDICLELRSLLTKNKRIIISNVCPVIPNCILKVLPTETSNPHQPLPIFVPVYLHRVIHIF